MLPSAGFAGKDELVKKITNFKTSFTGQLHNKLIFEIQLNANAIMYVVEIIVNNHGIQGDQIPYISALAEEYASNKDLVSLLILAAMCLHYVPHKSREMILRLMMILQASMSEVVQEHSPQSEHVFDLISDKFKNINPENQMKLIEESQTIISSAAQQHHSATNLFSHDQGGLLHTLESPLSLLAALCATWSIYSLKK